MIIGQPEGGYRVLLSSFPILGRLIKRNSPGICVMVSIAVDLLPLSIPEKPVLTNCWVGCTCATSVSLIKEFP